LRFLFILIFIPLFALAQSDFNVTGRISMRVQQISYDEDSPLLPDEMDADTYGKALLVPGLQQSLNVALFGRSKSLDMTLLADINNNDWDDLDFSDLNSVGRLTMNLRFSGQEIRVGDFFKSNSELFMQSREVRGFNYSGKFQNVFGKGTYVELDGIYGMTQRSIEKGERLYNLYRQFETTGQFARNVGSFLVRGGKSGVFDAGIKYLKGEDDKNSIKNSFNKPLSNTVAGGDFNAYLFQKNLRLFGEFYQSEKDTIDIGKKNDMAYRAGLDFRYSNFKLMLVSQYLGYNYFTMGYPFLENDKFGFLGNIAYMFPKVIALQSNFELYDDNLDDLENKPTTSTQFVDFGFTTLFPEVPQFSLKVGLRTDKSDEISDKEGNPLQSDKTTTRFQGRISHQFGRHRFSISTIYLDLDDKSLLVSGTPLGTEQIISSANVYSQFGQLLFFSGGVVYSSLKLTNEQTNDNIYFYESNRWDILPRKLKLETNLTLIKNNADNGGVQDYLSDYLQYKGDISLEYFFSDYISFKIIAGIDTKEFDYSKQQALQVIANDAYGPLYFNGNESYSGFILGGELNWTF